MFAFLTKLVLILRSRLRSRAQLEAKTWVSLLKTSSPDSSAFFECATTLVMTTPTTGAVRVASREPRSCTSLLLEMIALRHQIAILSVLGNRYREFESLPLRHKFRLVDFARKYPH